MSDNQERAYLRFIDETLRARELVNEQFARKVFDYLEDDPSLGRQEFVLLLAELLQLADQPDIAAKYMAQRPDNFYADPERQLDGTPSKRTLAERFRLLDEAEIQLEACIPADDPMARFFQEKFANWEQQPHLYDDNSEGVEFNLCFKFTIELAFEQRLDVLHHLICALHRLSKEKPKLRQAIEVLNQRRRKLIDEATRESEDSPVSIRAIKSRTHDLEVEKQWADGAPPTSDTSFPPETMTVAKEKRAFGGTQDQNIFAIYILFAYLQAKGTNTDKAKFISFLTGFSAEKCRQMLSNPTKKATDNFTDFEKDVEIVKAHFQKLGLTELSKWADNEVERPDVG